MSSIRTNKTCQTAESNAQNSKTMNNTHLFTKKEFGSYGMLTAVPSHSGNIMSPSKFCGAMTTPFSVTSPAKIICRIETQKEVFYTPSKFLQESPQSSPFKNQTLFQRNTPAQMLFSSPYSLSKKEKKHGCLLTFIE